MPNDTPTDGVFVTTDAAQADRLIAEHRDCPYTDTESITFGCYSHDNYVGIRYIG